MKQILALALLLFTQIACWAITKEQNLTNLEKQILGISYTKDSSETRLSRLEEAVFGNPNTGTVENRLEKLNKTFQVPKAQIPESFKEEIIEKKQMKQNAQAKPEIKVQILENSSEVADSMLKVINQERSFRSLRNLSRNAIADKVALEHASYLIQTKQFSHYGVSGQNPDQRYSAAGGTGRIEEIVDGFFASVDEQGHIIPISISGKTAEQLMDALIKIPDKSDILFNQDANAVGISFVVSPDKKQMAVVIEVLADYVSLANLPLKSSPTILPIGGSISGAYKFAWIGVAKRETNEDIEKIELEPSPYFPPIDKVIYADRSTERAKTIAKTSGLFLAMIAAPFTYGASMLVADLLMQNLAQAYQAQDVEVREGVKASENSFSGSVGVGEWGSGTYYISIWAFPSGSKKPVIISRRIVYVS